MPKPLKILLFCCIILFCVPGRSQELPTYKNEIRLGIFEFMFSSANLSFERYYGNKSIVIQAEANYFEKYDGIRQGYMFQLEPRFYLVEELIESDNSKFYLAPSINFRHYKSSIGNNIIHSSGKYNSIFISLLGGGKIRLQNNFVLDVCFGMSYKTTIERSSNIIEKYVKILHPGFTGIRPKANIGLGINF